MHKVCNGMGGTDVVDSFVRTVDAAKERHEHIVAAMDWAEGKGRIESAPLHVLSAISDALYDAKRRNISMLASDMRRLAMLVIHDDKASIG